MAQGGSVYIPHKKINYTKIYYTYYNAATRNVKQKKPASCLSFLSVCQQHLLSAENTIYDTLKQAALQDWN
jgi:hypothetical protein